MIYTKVKSKFQMYVPIPLVNLVSCPRNFNKNVIKWPYYYIDKLNRVSTRIYEKGTFYELKHKHPYFISGSSHKGQMGFQYRLDFTKAKFIK